MEDEKIVDLFFARSDLAISELDTKYGKTCHQLSYKILNNLLDAEECVNDAYLGTWNAIPPARPSAFRAWLGRIVRNLSLDRWKQSRTAKRGGDGMEVLLGELDDCVPEPHGTEKTMEDQEIASLISAFLRRQSPESRIIFLRRYWYGQSVADIAAGMNCGEGKVKSSLFRTRKALRTYLEQEEVFL
mgnify:CR=1 FL=1